MALRLGRKELAMDKRSSFFDEEINSFYKIVTGIAGTDKSDKNKNLSNYFANDHLETAMA
jgi:hypothetical protein